MRERERERESERERARARERESESEREAEAEEDVGEYAALEVQPLKEPSARVRTHLLIRLSFLYMLGINIHTQIELQHTHGNQCPERMQKQT